MKQDNEQGQAANPIVQRAVNNPRNEVPQIQEEVLSEYDRLKKAQYIEQYMAFIKQVDDVKFDAIAKPPTLLKSMEMNQDIVAPKEKIHLIKRNIHQLKEPSEISAPSLSYTNEKVEHLIALQLPSNALVKTFDRSMQIKDEFITHLIESAIKNGAAVLLLPNAEGLILKNLGNEVLQLIHLKSDNNRDEFSQDLIYGIFALSPWEVSFVHLQHELPYSFEMRHSSIIENLVKIVKSEYNKKVDLLKQLVDPADYDFITKKHLLLQEDQDHYSELKFSELLNFTLVGTGTYCAPLTVLNRGNDNIAKYQYRGKINENIDDAINKIGDNFDYSAALLPLTLRKHDFAAIFLKKTDLSSLCVTLINPSNENLQNEENFGFLSKALFTIQGYFSHKFIYLNKFKGFNNNDDSGPLVINCVKLLSTLKDFKSNLFETQRLVDVLNIDLVRKEHARIFCDKYEIPVLEDFSVKEVQPLGILEHILELD